MWVTSEGHKLTGDEIEINDKAYIAEAWLLEIYSGTHELLGKEIMYRGVPDETTTLYWIARYKGKYMKVSRIKMMEIDDLPFDYVSEFY